MPRRRYAGRVLPPQSEAKSVPAWNRVHAAQASGPVVGERQVHRHGRRVGRLLGRDLPDQPARVLVPHPPVQIADRGPVGRPPVRVRPQAPHRDALGRRSAGQPLEHLVHPPGDERLLGVRLQSRCAQPVRQVGRPVVAVVLPLEAAPSPRKYATAAAIAASAVVSSRSDQTTPSPHAAPSGAVIRSSGAGSSRRSICQPADGATGPPAQLHVVRREQLGQVRLGHRRPRSWRAGGSRCASRCRQPCRR